MSSSKAGKISSETEILNITMFGIWILVNGREYFLDYENYPWFKEAKVSDIYNFEFQHGHNLHWPTLDIDLSLDILENPEKYPKISKS